MFIRIQWREGIEYVPFDLRALPQKGESIESKEYWPSENESVVYKPRYIKSELVGDSIHKFTLQYSKREHPAPEMKGASWGQSVIKINTKTLTVSAEWFDDLGETCSGKAKRCQVLEDNLLQGLDYESVDRLLRPEQPEFRKRLLQLDNGQCSITGEMTRAALEAAHIVDASQGGTYTPANGILLRADLHRLFDKRLLKIMQTGKVVLAKEVSARYHEELKGKHLAPDVLKRVARALEKRAKLPKN